MGHRDVLELRGIWNKKGIEEKVQHHGTTKLEKVKTN
jgi:hypothetical protein